MFTGCTNVTYQKLLRFMANLCNWSLGLCGAFSTPYNRRTFRLLIGKILKTKPNNKTDTGAWLTSHAKEAVVFAQASAYFPTSWCLSKPVLLLLKTTKNLRALGANLQQVNFCLSEALMLTVSSLSAFLKCFVRAGGIARLIFWRRGRQGGNGCLFP